MALNEIFFINFSEHLIYFKSNGVLGFWGLLLEGPPGFVADAVADPATGLLAAVLTLAALGSGRGHLVDVSLAGTARWMAGEGRVVGTANAGEVSAPRARRVGPRAAELGEDTGAVMAGLGS